jgi:SAM-dependent methyltransferase
MKEAEQLDNYLQAYTDEFPYSEENHLMLRAYGEHIAQYIRNHEVRAALSLGIGYAEVTQRILSTLTSGLLKQYVVVDGAPQIIEGFRRSLGPVPLPGLELVEGFFETFVSSERFEVIEAGFILEHVDDPAFVLRRLHQFLLPGGRVFIAVPNARSLHRVLGHKAGLLEDMYVLSSSDLALGHKHYFDLDSISELVRAAGFKVAKTKGLLLKPFTTGQLNTLNLSPNVWRALLEVSAEYPAISNAIYLEATA